MVNFLAILVFEANRTIGHFARSLSGPNGRTQVGPGTATKDARHLVALRSVTCHTHTKQNKQTNKQKDTQSHKSNDTVSELNLKRHATQ